MRSESDGGVRVLKLGKWVGKLGGDSLSKLGLYFARLDIDNTDVSDDFTLLPSFFT